MASARWMLQNLRGKRDEMGFGGTRRGLLQEGGVNEVLRWARGPHYTDRAWAPAEEVLGPQVGHKSSSINPLLGNRADSHTDTTEGGPNGGCLERPIPVWTKDWMGPCSSAMALFISLQTRLNPRMVMAVGRGDCQLTEKTLPYPSEMGLEINTERRFGQQES